MAVMHTQTRRSFIGQAGIAGGVGLEFVQTQGDRLEITRKMLQALEGRVDDETFANQPSQLRFDILHCCRMCLAGGQFFLHRLPFRKDQPDKTADFLHQQSQTWLGLLAAGAERGFVMRPGRHQAGACQREVDQLDA